MTDDKTNNANVATISDLLQTKPEHRRDGQIDRLSAATASLPFFAKLQQDRPFSVDAVRRELCKTMRLLKVKAGQAIVKAGNR